MSIPIFPPEIEHIIVTCALGLKTNDQSPSNLMLVAKRFHTWLSQELIQTVAVRTVRDTRFHPRGWSIDVIKEYGAYAKNLFLFTSTNDERAVQYISFCPNITNLVLWTELDEAHLKGIARLPLTHLSADIDLLPQTTELCQLFSRITHFDCIGGVTYKSDLPKLKAFTSLTHLVLPSDNFSSLPTAVLADFPGLKVLVFLDSGREEMAVVNAFDPEADDPRVLRMTCNTDDEMNQWLLDIQNGSGLWELADKVVQERKDLKNAFKKKMAEQ
ncbi:hypothetical protein BDN72DRAFT_962827 [Pluteus cervinus]|uniref:Uncharacterized protein n=1 Tax=Pluteus cervinus TaxID=181527 RepID=A0ACD3AH72_9AGAR|nr:hypothetical protein BDN72DRAFT_962827 [Pluteus cervinus]